jgi:hypothetical protein
VQLSLRIYAVLAAVFLGSFTLAWLLTTNPVGREIATAPAVLSLVGALYQLIRDEAAHVKQLALQHDQQRFELGATSHMANVAFDKHVAFCEEYVPELHKILESLAVKGATDSMVAAAQKLLDIRRRHSVWITPDVEDQLGYFESALAIIGAAAAIGKMDPEKAEERGYLREMRDMLADVVGTEKDDPTKAIDRDIAVTTILDRIRDILGVRQLIVLRQRLLELRQFSDASAESALATSAAQHHGGRS